MGATFTFIPKPPSATTGRTKPLSYKVTATIGTDIKATRTITQDNLDELRQEYEDLPKRASQDRTQFDQSPAAYTRLLDPPDVENGRHQWHILTITNLNQHAIDTDAKYDGALNVTCGYRCPISNERFFIAGTGSRTSNHQYGRALDFNQGSSLENYNVFTAARNAGDAGDTYLSGSDGVYYYADNRNGRGIPTWPAPSNITYKRGHAAW
jgi:uncharacterized protein YcbK (DUF882 family)